MKTLCDFGLHKWKQVRTYSAVGVRSIGYMGIPIRDHYPWHGVEKCSRCAKRVTGRKDAVDVVFDIGSVVIFCVVAAAMIPVLMILCKILWAFFIEVWRVALQ